MEWFSVGQQQGLFTSSGQVLKRFRLWVNDSSWDLFEPRFCNEDFVFGANDYRQFITIVSWSRCTRLIFDGKTLVGAPGAAMNEKWIELLEELGLISNGTMRFFQIYVEGSFWGHIRPRRYDTQFFYGESMDDGQQVIVAWESISAIIAPTNGINVLYNSPLRSLQSR